MPQMSPEINLKKSPMLKEEAVDPWKEVNWVQLIVLPHMATYYMSLPRLQQAYNLPVY